MGFEVRAALEVSAARTPELAGDADQIGIAVRTGSHAFPPSGGSRVAGFSSAISRIAPIDCSMECASAALEAAPGDPPESV